MEELGKEHRFSDTVHKIGRALRTAGLSLVSEPKESIVVDPETGLPASANTGYYIIDDDIQESD